MPHTDPLYLLHRAAESGSPGELAGLAAEVGDVDALSDGRSALWLAVYGRRDDNARALVAAGADPWRPMMSGWSPGRLSLAGPTPELFGEPREELTPAERAAVAASQGLIAALDDIDDDGWSVCCVAGLTADEAIGRLDAVELREFPEFSPDAWLDDRYLNVLGFTDVPGGCVVAQPWAYGASFPVVSRLLSRGTVAYAMYANPKSGDQGSVYRDGAFVGGDLSPGSWPEADADSEEVLRTFLYLHEAPAYCCAYAGLTATSDAFLEPRRFARLPERDYWAFAAA